jgi:hypothetical protein
MILDALLQVSDAQAVTDTDAYSTNTIDLGNVTPKRQIGDGEDMCFMVTVDVAAASGAGTVEDQFDFLAVQSVNADLSSHTVMQQRRVPVAELVAGAIVVVDIPPGRPTARYIGMRYEVAAGDTITVSAWLLPKSFVTKLKDYAKGYVITG